MADIFVSYAREDQRAARRVVEALEAQGWDVWWDRELVAGEHFGRSIEQEIESAGCVLVLWSRHSVESGFVQGEAGIAAESDKLIPVTIEPVGLPVGFRSLHTLSLPDWDDSGSKDFETLLTHVERQLGKPRRARPRLRWRPRIRRPILLTSAVSVLFLFLSIYLIRLGSLPLVEYWQGAGDGDGERWTVSYFIENLSDRVAFANVGFLLRLSGEGRFTDADTVLTPPAFDGDEPPEVHGESATYWIETFNPGDRFRLVGKYTADRPDVELFLHKDSSTGTSLRLEPRSGRTLVMRYRKPCLAGVLSAWLLLAVMAVRARGWR